MRLPPKLPPPPAASAPVTFNVSPGFTTVKLRTAPLGQLTLVALIVEAPVTWTLPPIHQLPFTGSGVPLARTPLLRNTLLALQARPLLVVSMAPLLTVTLLEGGMALTFAAWSVPPLIVVLPP